MRYACSGPVMQWAKSCLWVQQPTSEGWAEPRLLCFRSSFLLMHLRRQQMAAQVLGPPATHTEMQIKLRAPGFSLVLLWRLWPFEECTRRWKILSLLPHLSNKEIFQNEVCL